LNSLRSSEIAKARSLLELFPVVGILGPRQVGKTTLSREIADGWDGSASIFDLENPVDTARLADPMLALSSLRGLVVLDEIQRRPELFPVLRVLADRPGCPARFLVLGSAAPELLKQASESLAGRIAYQELGGFSLGAVGGDCWRELWVRGGFPRAFLDPEPVSATWRSEFVRTFLERDLPQLGIGVPATTMRRFWTMLAHSHGQLWNGAQLARSFGVSEMTVRRYLDHLAQALVVRTLQPWYENIAKRQVKSPRVFLSDTGILHALLSLDDEDSVLGHPGCGASFEGFVIDQAARFLGADRQDLYSWRTADGAELDLLWARGARRVGIEAKLTSAPTLTPSMRIALADLRLERLLVVHAGDESWPMAERVEAVAIRALPERLPAIAAKT
jgi:predicted AAA+ superfamily ATPase